MAVAAMRAGTDAAVTIAARTHKLAAPDVEGASAQVREARRMVDEKILAACEGAFAAQMAWGAFVMKATLGGVRTFEDAALGLAGVAEAAVKPARRTVRANAKRLTGRGRLR